MLISLSLIFFADSNPDYQKEFEIPYGQEIVKIPKNDFNISKYAHIIINGVSDDAIYVLSAYYDSDSNQRQQLGQSKDGHLELIVSKDDFKEKVSIFLECNDYKKCSGIIEYKFVEKIELVNGEPFTYFISNNSSSLDFILETDDYDYLNVWVRGQYQLEVKFEESNTPPIKRREDEFGNFYLINGNQSNLNFKVSAQTKGDFINVGYIGYKYDSNSRRADSLTSAFVNGPALSGFLYKDILEEICFKIENFKPNDTIIANGLIYTKFARANLKNKDNSIVLPENTLEKDNFRLINQVSKEGQKICVSFPNSTDDKFDNYDEITFTIQLLNSNNKNLIFEPQLNGISYLRTVPVNSISFILPQNNGEFEKMTYSMMALDGHLKMYILDCDNYPLCLYEKLPDSNIQPININGFSTYNLDKTRNGYNLNTICQKQNLFVVTCENKNLCDFKSLIYKNNDKIILSEDKFFNQYAIERQEHYYKIDLENESAINKIDIDITANIGELEVNIDDLKEFNFEKKIEINKIIIHIEYNEKAKDEILFTVKALTNTYYTILVSITREGEENSKTLETGMTYLLTLDPEKDKNKLIKFVTESGVSEIPFMANFYSLNCEIEVKETKNLSSSEVEKYENFYHQIIIPEDYKEIKEDLDTFDYQINIKSGDISGNNICKIYTTGIEGVEEHDDYSKDILVQDNTPQQVTFNSNSKHYSFGYVLLNYKNDLLVKFNLKHSAKYNVTLYAQKIKNPREEIIVSDDLLYFKASSWEQVCKDAEICYLQLDITMEIARDSNSDTILELTAKSIDSTSVSYIPKNNIKRDYIQNQINQNYYTELGPNEEGFLIVNFLRGSGKALARIVSKDETESGANWRGKYVLPTEDNTMETNPLTKRLNFNGTLTKEKCKDGCFLLITIVSDIKDSSKDIRNYPYTLFVHSYLSDQNSFQSPSIISPLNSYIIGSVGTKNYSEFYSFWLNSDAEKVIIDLQSSFGGLIMYVGENKESINIEKIEEDTIYTTARGSDYAYEFSKSEILEKFNKNKEEKRDSIKGLVLNIALRTNFIDSFYQTPFAFSVALQIKGLEIIRVNSDQKVLCNPIKYQDIYRCLYIVEYDFLNEKNDDLFIFAFIEDKSADFNIYAKKVTSDYYELALHEDINQYLPSRDNHDYSSENQTTDYLYIKDWDNKNEYILVSVEVSTKSDTSVQLITHIPLLQTDIIPNLANFQLISIKKDNSISFTTSDKYMPMIGIMCIGGSGEIYWTSQNKNKYYLKGRDDRLQMTTKKLNEELRIRGTGDLDEDYGMIFVLYYNLKPFETDLASLALDSSVRYIYNEIDFPISYCSAINELNKDSNSYYEFFFTFDRLKTDENNVETYYEYDPFDIYAFIVNASFIADIKINPEKRPSDLAKSVLGDYDQSMRTGIVRVTQQLLNMSGIEPGKNPYLYLEIDEDKQINQKKYTEINVETTMLKSNSSFYISESSNQFGYLKGNEEQRVFKLRNDKSKKYLILEFSCESDSLIPSFKNKENVQGNEFYYGKTFYSLETKNEDDLIYFYISRNNATERDDAFFMFRFTFEDEINYKKYNIQNSTLKVTKKALSSKTFNYTIELTPMDDWSRYNLAYIARIIESEMPNKSFLSLKPVHQRSKEYENPQPTENKLIFEIPNVTIYNNKNEEYVQVIVQIKSDEKVEYISYDLQNKWDEDEEGEKEEEEGKEDEKEDGEEEGKEDEKDDGEGEGKENEKEEGEGKENEKEEGEGKEEEEEGKNKPGTDSDSDPGKGDDDDDDDKTLIIVISCVGGVVIILLIGLVLYLLYYNKKSQNLSDQVNAISFKEDKDKDTLLLSDDKNALE